MSNRIQRVSNKVNTAAIAIGYTPNKSTLSPLSDGLSGLNIDTSLIVRDLTATASFKTGLIYADTIVANVITTTSSLTGVNDGTFLNALTATDGVVDTLNVKQYIYSDSSVIKNGESIPNSGSINFTFSYNNKVYIFAKVSQFSLLDYIQIYDIYNINKPNFLLSSYNIARPASPNYHSINENTKHLYYNSIDSIYAYNLNTQNIPVSAARRILPPGTNVENIFIKNNYLYAQLSNPSRLEILDIKNPSTITFTGSCNLFGRNIFGVFDNFVLTNITALTGGNYVERVGIIDTVIKSTPYRLNETNFDNINYYSSAPSIYKNYIYRVYNDYSLSASKIYFYDAFEFIRKPFVPTLTNVASSTLQGYENLYTKKFIGDRLYISSTGQIGFLTNQFPKGFSVWDFSNISQPLSAYFWNDTENNIGPGSIYGSFPGGIIAGVSTSSAVQLFYTYNANLEGIKTSYINARNFDTFNLNTENIEFINATGSTLSAINVVSNDVLPVLPVPRINLKGVTGNIWYGGNTDQQLSAGGVFTLERTPQLIQDDFTQEVIGKHKIFLEILTFKKRKQNNARGQYKGYTYTSPALNLETPIWENFWNRLGVTGNDPNTRRTNYIPITSVGKNIDLSQMLHMRFREKIIAYRSLSSVNPSDYNHAPLLCPYHASNKKGISVNYPKYPYARAYAPLYVAFRYIAWLPEANNSKGQIISGPLSPRLRIANKLFPFYTNHHESSIKGYPVAGISPHYLVNFDDYKKTFTCNFC